MEENKMLDAKTIELFRELIALQEQKYRLGENEINFIIKNNIKDVNRIERAIDEILEFLEDEEALLLFRRICSYYVKINPQATLDYINYYIKEYDPQKLKFGNKNKEN